MDSRRQPKLFLVGVLVIAMVLSCQCVAPVTRSSQQSAFVELLHRVLPPQLAGLFVVELLPAGSASNNVWEIETNATNVILRGSNAPSLGSALKWYMKYRLNASISWEGVVMPSQVPMPPPPAQPSGAAVHSASSPFSWFFYMNTCTFGYSTLAWNFSRWEKEIDWMCLNGINLPLAMTGQEWLWIQTFKQFGVSVTDMLNGWLSGPAYLPWNRMGNLNAWMGPLPHEWALGQVLLQQLITQRMRDLGMTPVLPGFSGHVPEQMLGLFPDVSFSTLTSYPPASTYFLNPNTTGGAALWANISATFYRLQTDYYGATTAVSIDPFNEIPPPSSSPDYVASVSAAISDAVHAFNPDAMVVMMGWFVVAEPELWPPSTLSAFLGSFPRGRLLVIDYWSEIEPIYPLTHNWYNHSFLWSMLHNFGGRQGWYGTMPRVANGPTAALIATNSSSNNLAGLSLVPEGLYTSSVMYDLVSDLYWLTSPPSLAEWTDAYVTARYGLANANASAAWQILRETVFACNTSQQGPTQPMWMAQPSFANATKINCCDSLVIYYATADLYRALGLLLATADAMQAGGLPVPSTLTFDLVIATVQTMMDVALKLYANMRAAWEVGQLAAFQASSQQFLQLMDDTDSLLATHSSFLLGPWIQGVQSMSPAPSEWALLNQNARWVITMWAPANSSFDLHEYAGKWMSGLVSSYYRPRWASFAAAVESSLSSGQPFSQTAFDAAMFARQTTWANNSTQPFPLSPTGSTVETTRQLFVKYGRYFVG